jgi:uncharacterized protein (DUF952 family)
MPQDKFQLRLKVLEEGLRMSASRTSTSAARRQSIGSADGLTKTNGFLSKHPSFQMRTTASTMQKGHLSLLMEAVDHLNVTRAM